MSFSKRLKSLRLQSGYSQEQLAEMLNVSRQAITKWETAAGLPDIENIIAIANLFDVSIDELLARKFDPAQQPDFLYESVTEYDIAERKHYDIKLGAAKFLGLSCYDGEKIQVRFASNTLSEVVRDFKVKIDDTRQRLDIDVSRSDELPESSAKEGLSIFVLIPAKYVFKIEVASHAECVEIANVACFEDDSLELGLKSSCLTLDNVTGHVELDCNIDMEVNCKTLDGRISINQIKSMSLLRVPEKTLFKTQCKGFRTKIRFEKNGKPCEPFDTADADNIIEFNGMGSELTICEQHIKSR